MKFPNWVHFSPQVLQNHNEHDSVASVALKVTHSHWLVSG